MFDFLSRLISVGRARPPAPALSQQQRLLLEQKHSMLSMLDQANEALDRKGATVLQSSTIIVAFISAFKLTELLSSSPSIWIVLSLAGVFATFIAMIVFVILAWRPAPILIPGYPGWDDQFEKYIDLELDACYHQILSDLLKSIEEIQSVNKTKGKNLNISMYLLIAQIAFLLLTVIQSAYSAGIHVP